VGMLVGDVACACGCDGYVADMLPLERMTVNMRPCLSFWIMKINASISG
jgi:hypothetical protein